MMPARMRPRPKMRHLPVKWRSHLRAMPLLTSSVFVMARQHEARARARLRPCDARAPPSCSRSGGAVIQKQFGAPCTPKRAGTVRATKKVLCGLGTNRVGYPREQSGVRGQVSCASLQVPSATWSSAHRTMGTIRFPPRIRRRAPPRRFWTRARTTNPSNCSSGRCRVTWTRMR